MGNPTLHRDGQRRQSFMTGGQVYGHVELIATLPIAFGIFAVDDVDMGLGRNSQHGDQWRYRSRIGAADLFLVSRYQRAFVDGDALGAKKHLAAAHDIGVLDAVERIAHNDVDELVDE